MIPGIDPNTLIVIAWTLAALAMAWTWISALISALGGTRYTCGGTSDLHGMEPSAAEPDYAFWAEQLLALGYEPLGNAWMRINFAGSDWSMYSPVRVFYHPSKLCFAYMQKAPAPFHFWPGAVFATCWADGGFLVTDNNLAADPHPDDEFIRQGLVSLKLADVEAFHLATMEVLRRNRKPDTDLGMDTLLHAFERYLGPEAKAYHSRAGTQHLFAHVLIHICLSTPFVFLAGIGHWTVPVANLVLAMVLLIGESSHKRQFAKAVRAALRMRQALPMDKRGELEV